MGILKDIINQEALDLEALANKYKIMTPREKEQYWEMLIRENRKRRLNSGIIPLTVSEELLRIWEEDVVPLIKSGKLKLYE